MTLFCGFPASSSIIFLILWLNALSSGGKKPPPLVSQPLCPKLAHFAGVLVCWCVGVSVWVCGVGVWVCGCVGVSVSCTHDLERALSSAYSVSHATPHFLNLYLKNNLCGFSHCTRRHSAGRAAPLSSNGVAWVVRQRFHKHANPIKSTTAHDTPMATYAATFWCPLTDKPLQKS